jgi:Ca-activated chloride channel family protein
MAGAHIGKGKNRILKAIEELYGGYPGESGIVPLTGGEESIHKGGNNRVILATDGDFNVGQSSEEELDNLITQHQQWGSTYLPGGRDGKL